MGQVSAIAVQNQDRRPRRFGAAILGMQRRAVRRRKMHVDHRRRQRLGQRPVSFGVLNGHKNKPISQLHNCTTQHCDQEPDKDDTEE